MTAPASQDFWPDLSALGTTEENGREARATLLVVNAEMFVAAPARDREAIETFESLALGFLPTVDNETRAEVARILAPCPDIPEAVQAYLLRTTPAIRDIVIDHSRQPTGNEIRRLFGTTDGRVSLAARAGIDADTIQKLLALEENSVDDALAANRAFAACERCFSRLIERARHRPALAHILLARDDLEEHREAALYLAAPSERRADIRRKMADALAERRAVLFLRVTPDDKALIAAAAREGDDDKIEAFFNFAFGFPDTTAWHLLRIGRHELLALALKALGMETRMAMGIFMDLHPALAHPPSTLKHLVRVMAEVESAIAMALIEQILNVRVLSSEDET